jgi:aminomethyltransferase
MPVEYSGIVNEHLSVRSTVGLFDVSHMGEISVSGPEAPAFLNGITTNDVSKLETFQAQYSAILNDRGGVIDDLLVYRRPKDYLLVPNAANSDRVWSWLSARAGDGVRLANLGEATGQIAVQGPKSPDLVQPFCSDDLAGIGYYHSRFARIGDVECFISRTGYTGEDGFEIYTEAAKTGVVWDLLMRGSPSPRPCGLGARDTLRLEMAFRLHGADMDEATTPLEAGLGWIVKMDKGDFVGKGALVGQMKRGIPRRIVGLKTESKRFPRHGHSVLVEGKVAGKVTSGGFAPSLGCGVALAYVDSGFASADNSFKIDVKGQVIDAVYHKGPFYKGASHK